MRLPIVAPLATTFGVPAIVAGLLTFMPEPRHLAISDAVITDSKITDYEIHGAVPVIPVRSLDLPAFWPPRFGPLHDLPPADIVKNALGPEDPAPEERFTLLADYAYSEVPPPVRPADVIAERFKHIPVGSPLQEIALVCDAFGLDPKFMTAVARIESDFDPKQRTGHYVGLYQLSDHEFRQYGPTGPGASILNPRDNALAAADKIVTEAAIFKMATQHVPSQTDLYLIHQQGIQGAARHIEQPERPAWQSMCATDEGKQKGEDWCKRAIWANTLPTIKATCKTVTALTSGAFVAMWQDRVKALLGSSRAPDSWRVTTVHHKTTHPHGGDHERKGERKVAAHHHRHRTAV
jgi:hypothetical protein